METQEIQVIEIIGIIMAHEYFIAIYGVLAFYAGYVLISLGSFTPSPKYPKWSFIKWKRNNLAGFIATIVFAPLVIIMDDEMLALYNWWTKGKDMPPVEKLGDTVYLLAGPFAIVVTKFISWLKNFKVNIKQT